MIRGETPHFEFVAGEAASGLQLAGLETGIPVAFGVLTCENVEQAEARIERRGRGRAWRVADLFVQMRAEALVPTQVARYGDGLGISSGKSDRRAP